MGGRAARPFFIRPTSCLRERLGKLGLRERLREARYIDVFAGREVRVPAREHDRDLREARLDLRNELRAGHARHCVIGHEQVESGAREFLERLTSGLDREYFVSKVLQHIDSAHEDERVVIDRKDGKRFDGVNRPGDRGGK